MGSSSLKNVALASALLLSCLALTNADATIPTECPAQDDPDVVVHLAYEGDCTKFYKCSNGEKFLMSCPVYNEDGDRLYFNASLQVCDWPDQVDCPSDKLFLPLGQQLKQHVEFSGRLVATVCPAVDPINQTVYLVHEDDCTKFYTCSHGAKHEMECPAYNEEGDRLYFNPEIERCDWPINVDCPLPNPKPKVFRASLAAIPTSCPAEDEPEHPVHLAHESDCTKFYACSHGVKHELSCPVINDKGERLYFNVAKQYCDWPSNVQCHN